MPVGFVGSGHVLSSQSPAHDGVVVVLHSPAAQSDVIETRSISCLIPDGRDGGYVGWIKMTKYFRLYYGCVTRLQRRHATCLHKGAL